jgi:alkylation response protein AidB-like acyl-CoA dehydrogenase
VHSPLLDEERRSFVDELRRFACDELADPGWAARDAAGEFWQEGWRRCAAMGLCGLPVPEELGGSGADRVTTAAALEALGYGCADAGLLFSLNAHLWSAVVPIWLHGSDEQRERYLRRLCGGEWIGLHAMTEPGSGSDAFALTTVADRDGDGFVLRGRKTLITNTPLASVFVVFARAPGSDRALGISAYLVDAGTEGVSVGRTADKMGLRTSPMADLVLEDVRVGPDAVLGKAGRGAAVFASSMEWERLLVMAAQLGGLERAVEEAAAAVRGGEAEPHPDVLAETRVALAGARALMYETAAAYDAGETRPGPAAAVKLLASETVLRAAIELSDVRRMRDAAGGRIYSGTSQLMRRLVAREMGL